MTEASSGRVRVYMASSLDGYIAGPDDDLSWLHEDDGAASEAPTSQGGVSYESFIADVGLMLMGRRTFDVVSEFDTWFYGDLPIWVVTHRALDAPNEHVEATSGDIASIIARAKEVAGEKDIYLDGGDLIRQALVEGLVDELIITYLPVVLGGGISLFGGLDQRLDFSFESHHDFHHNMLQVRMVPRSR